MTRPDDDKPRYQRLIPLLLLFLGVLGACASGGIGPILRGSPNALWYLLAVAILTAAAIACLGAKPRRAAVRVARERPRR